MASTSTSFEGSLQQSNEDNAINQQSHKASRRSHLRSSLSFNTAFSEQALSPSAEPQQSAESSRRHYQSPTVVTEDFEETSVSQYDDAVEYQQDKEDTDPDLSYPPGDPASERINANPRGCTRRAEDVVRLRAAAAQLCHYAESEMVIEDLIQRLDRMVEIDRELAATQDTKERTLAELATELVSFLDAVKDGRVATGESPHFVGHQLMWADWLLECVEANIYHLPNESCGCLGVYD
ncbi:hypothetical protein AOQ84DRAFT_371674 [Glonium stellatum]|uniref:Uncharacterized protein n=1 Tax=Glonium stellatum TaxID=574774 RepID=A0A8E2FB92_9PEZI|nr:hypothetical protein AOQ84DRAFT_371674 [Glonium stellatum]